MTEYRAIEFVTQHRVRFREVDPHGHMNMGHYLTHLADHRFDGMRKFLGLDYRALESLPIAFHTRRIELDYVRPLHVEQTFVIKSRVIKSHRAALWVEFDVLDDQGETAAKALMKVGCIDRQNGRPTRWPEHFMDRFFEKVES